MPMSLEPDKRYPIVLDCDKDQPSETRPTFWVKSQSMRDQRRLSSTVENLHGDSKEINDLFDAAIDVAAEIVVGWDNMVDPKTKEAIPFSKDTFNSLLTYSEVRELIQKTMSNDHLTEDEKKSSE